MKKILLVAVLIVASVQLRASHLASELELKIADKGWFTLTLDNQDFNTPVTRFQTFQIEPGRHYLVVNRIAFGYHHQPYIAAQLFSGFVHIPATSKVEAIIDRYGRFRMYNVSPLYYHEIPAPAVCQPVPAPVVYGMCDADFRQLVRLIDNLSFDSSKLQVARQALEANVFTSVQVRELVSLMTFESSRLELAKTAYRNTVDKQNFYMVNDAFTFESSIMELDRFIHRT